MLVCRCVYVQLLLLLLSLIFFFCDKTKMVNYIYLMIYAVNSNITEESDIQNFPTIQVQSQNYLNSYSDKVTIVKQLWSLK